MSIAISRSASQLHASRRAAADVGGSAPADRRGFHGLHHLSDAMLRDIGLEREDRTTLQAFRARDRLVAGAFW